MGLDKSNSIVSVVPNVNVVPVVIDYNVSQITPYVFVTAEGTARQVPTLFSNGIGCVINVAEELPQMVFPPQSGIESLKYPILDIPTFPAAHYFDTVADRIAANVASNRRTLLYCHHGRSRSITFILAYLIKHHRLPLSTAYAIVKEKRQIALPNVGFWSQLMSYESYQRQRQQQPQQQRPSQQQLQLMTPLPIIQNVQDSLAYGQQVLTKISTGFEQIIAQDPFVNAFVDQQMSIYLKPNSSARYRTIRRRPAVFTAPYHFRLPPGVYIKRFF